MAALLVVAVAVPGREVLAAHATCADDPATLNVINFDLANSYCELCGEGEIRIVVTNPSHEDMTDIVVSHDLDAAGGPANGLRYVAGSTTVNGAATGDPVITGGGSVLTWSSTEISELATLNGTNNHFNFNEYEIVFRVQIDPALNAESLVTASTVMSASAAFDFCAWPRTTDSTGDQAITLREPVPGITKLGRNVDAEQTAYTATVYGNTNDDVIWQVTVNNGGQADLQDLIFSDFMTENGGESHLTYVCPTENDAEAIAITNNGSGPAGNCVAIINNQVDPLARDSDFFGNPAAVDVTAGGTASAWFVGKIASSCNDQTNTVNNLQWGCQVTATPDGGITQTSTGFTPADSSADLETTVDTGAGPTVTVNYFGIYAGDSVGTRGTVRITINNNTGGTIKNLVLDDVLPSTYYMADPTFDPNTTINVTHGQPIADYDGMIDTVTWTNMDSGNLMNNGSPHFVLESSTTHVDAGSNLLRHGDTLTFEFRIILIDDTYFDKQANIDEPVEAAGADDPPTIGALPNQLTVNYEEFCGGAAPALVLDETFTPNPEDIDVDMDEDIYVLTNDPGQLLPLTVVLTNRGGHRAENHYTYVSFGETMEVVGWPAGQCSRVSYLQTPSNLPRPVWNQPAGIPDRATVYECTSGAIGRNGGTRSYNFQVRKVVDTDAEYAARLDADDLTFRADVVGEIRMSDDTLLLTPTPSDSIGSTTNNYSLDSIRARVIGFNLTKTQDGLCSENVAAAGTPDLEVQIGEECEYTIRSGGWFGFKTPGFSVVAVHTVQVDDLVPDGQGYISSTNPALTSDPEVNGFNPGYPPPDPPWTAPEEGTRSWLFNYLDVPPSPTAGDDRIIERDKWFEVNIRTRLLNDPQNSSAAPNVHAANSSNLLESTFVAEFQDEVTLSIVPYTITPLTVGYPDPALRRVDLVVTEPNITVVKEVCNETLYGTGAACTNFTTLADDGDTNDSYVYRITLTNEAASGGVTRAPAYNVVATDILDASDLMQVVRSGTNATAPFQNDNLDNDGDGLVDEADEGTISDNTINNGTPAEITFSHTHSSALQRVDPGNSVTLYYRVNTDDDVAPLQTLTNTVTMSYDSLEGDYGNMTDTPLRENGEIGGAREYQTTPAQASVQILPLLTQAKEIVAVSNPVLSGSPQPVSIGEEIRYRLTTLIPVSRLRNFVIRDELPAGIRCAEAPSVNLNTGVYASAGFVPGGTITPTCTSTGSNDYVEWDFGDQELTTATGTRFTFPVEFIARVENTNGTNENNTLSNGSPSTVATISYVDAGGNPVSLNFGNVDAVVREPVISLVKAFSVASADAGDLVTVTITATNTGTAPAYNLRVLDDLVGTRMTYVNTGADPPDNVDTPLGANRPIFSFDNSSADYTILPGDSIDFNFTVRVDADVEPGETLGNTVQAAWQSLPGQSTALNSSGQIGVDGGETGLRNGSLPIITGDVNDYETSATDTMDVATASISKNRISDTYDATANVRIGDTVTYELRINLPEATIADVVLNDTLPQGLRFERVTSINGDTSSPFTSRSPFTYTSFSAPTVTGDPVVGATTVTWDLGQIVNAGDNDTGNNDFVIRYEAIVLSGVHPQALNTPLTNTVTLDYTLGGVPVAQQSDSETINLVQPDLVMTKTGPVGVQFGNTSTFTLNLLNSGTSRAWDITLVDRLPNLDPAAGGMCDTPPTNITARVYQFDGSTPVSGWLVQGTDYTVSWATAPSCELTFTMRSAAAAPQPNQRLIVTYDAMPDNDNAGGVSLTNLAGATEWFSQDTAGAGATGQVETYTRTITDPDPGNPSDHQDDHTVVTAVPVLVFEKTVFNVTTGLDGASASPGDLLRYTITVRNTSDFAMAPFSLTDEVDRLSGGTALFAAGSLANVTVLGGGSPNTTSTDANGGTQGTGILDVRNLTLDAAGGANDTVTITFDVRLAAAINDGVTVQNQAEILIPNYILTPVSDYPVTATADDPTPTVISSATQWQVQKISTDLTGDPAILDTGDTLRYTITVKNVGNENAINATLRDQVPANTTYVANSTTLNGAAVADPAAGVSPLESGMLINAPEDTTPGAMRADASATTANVATITFDVTINNNVINGTAISNQGFVNGSGAGSGAFTEVPSDDPATAAINDPTINVVGSLPLVDAQKTVALTGDGTTPGQVDAGDTLTYTVTITNAGAVDATGVVFTDTLPTNTTYVPGSGLMNGAAAGIGFAAGTLTADYAGTYGNLARGATVTITFDVTVNGTVNNGDIISNQGTVSSNEQADEPTDADGIDSNGDQPTQIIVGNAQGLAISKQVAVVGGGVAQAGGQLEYTVVVTNIGTVVATDVVFTDDLAPIAGLVTYVAGSATLDGATAGTGYAPTIITADYGTTYGNLAPGSSATLRFRVQINGAVAIGTTITNTADVSWNGASQNNSASVSIDVGGTPGFANLNGSVWHDANFDNLQDAGERPLQNWVVDIYRNGVLFDSFVTDANGNYAINGLAPNDVSGDQYELRFRAPGATASSAMLGLADSVFTNNLHRISNIVAGSGSNLQNLNLPIDPNGVVYDSISRAPVAGAVVTLMQGGSALATTCFDDPNQQGQVTLADGYYKFDINASCLGGDYVINVAPPASGYTSGESLLIPASSNASSASYSVTTCSADAVGAPAGYCEAQAQETAPPLSVPPATAGTNYYLHVGLDSSSMPGSSQLFNNHIPLDPDIATTGITLTKTAAKLNVTRGELVPYTITATNALGGTLTGNDIIDTMPPGFKYVTGSARVDGVAVEPVITGRELRWSGLALVPGTPTTIKLLLTVGVGVGEGEYINQAQLYNTVLASYTAVPATATVRVVADPMFDCSDVIGKVFDDRNGNGYQDEGEGGIAGARVVTANGLLITTDKHGRYHVACAAVPSRDRGSNFVLKLDTRSLPSGYRLTTENPRVQRVTRGKLAKMNFGVALQHVVRLDLADAAFMPVRTELRPEWQPILDTVMKQLQKQASVLRISYLGDAETAAMVNARLKVVRKMLADRWQALDKEQELAIESEIFWRHGRPGTGGGGASSRDVIHFSKPNAATVYSDIGENAERIIPDAVLTMWARDESFAPDGGDPVYFESRIIEQIETSDAKSLKAVAIENGKPVVSADAIAEVRRMVDRAGVGKRVRMQFIGYTDDRPLSGEEKRRYADHDTMSVEHARLVAEYYRRELGLDEQQVTIEGRGTARAGRGRTAMVQGLNGRRVEMRLFIEQVGEQEVAEPLVVPRAGTRELRVCRVENVCVTVRKKKDARKVVINNLLPAIRFDGKHDRLTPEQVEQLRQAFSRYRDKPGAVLHFTGHVDSAGLNREAIDRYGDKVGLSRAQARSIADQVRTALGLASHQVSFDGKGDSQSLAVNSTARGRALNRRIEVSLWYDSPADILSIGEPQICPVGGGPDMISQRYLPEGQNPVAPVRYVGGKPVVNDADVQQLKNLLSQLSAEPNLRLVFSGYTDKSLLNRRSAIAHGDNWGLAEYRAKQVRDLLLAQLGLPAEHVSIEGKGFADSQASQGQVLASVDGFVDIEIWFDVPAPVDENVVAELRRIQQLTDPVNPFALAAARVTVDGRRLDATLPHQADVQRCTDVALARTRVKLRFDGSKLSPKLNLGASASAIARDDDPQTAALENQVRFQGYTNYPAMIKRAEVRLFRLSQSPGDVPLAVIELDKQWRASWLAGSDSPAELKYLLRVYDAAGNHDETRPQRLRVVPAALAIDAIDDSSLAARVYGGNALAKQAIPLRGGTITVDADQVPAGHQVWIMGQRAPVDNNGKLVTQQIVPKGLHTIEVAVLDDAGNGQVYLRDLNFDSRDWFYTGIADITVGMDSTSGPAALVTNDNTHFNNDVFTDGRLAFYVKGSTRNNVEITASVDTTETSWDEVFTDIAKRDPRALFRRLDSDNENYVYPSFGDDSTSVEDAPTQGRIYVKARKDDSFAMWGNFRAEWLDTDLARIDRGLYGAYGHYEGKSLTAAGNKRTRVDVFAAQPGTARAREQFRGTGGSQYFLRQRDLTQGSESVWVEVRDADSGLVLKTNRLVAGQDYSIDPIQGRVELVQPLPSTADNSQLVQSGSLSGHPVYLVVNYEYIPAVEQLDDSSLALRGSQWVSDKVRVGATYSSERQLGEENGLSALDVAIHKSPQTYVKIETAQTQGAGVAEYQSSDGGYFFNPVPQATGSNVSAGANRIEVTGALADFMDKSRGKFTAYFQQLDAGFAGAGQLTATDTQQYGANLNLPFGEQSDFNIKLDSKEVDLGLHTSALAIDYGRKLDKHWKLVTGIRHDSRDDQSPVVPLTQTEGDRTDAAVRGTYESGDGWKAYGFAQATLAKNGTRNANNRVGAGGEYQLNKRWGLQGEISTGDLGLGARFGANYRVDDDTRLYSTYALDNERDVSGLRTTKGNFVNGFRSRTSDSMTVYGEERYTHGDVPTGLTHAYGVELTPTRQWRLGANLEIGDLYDARTTNTIDRTALGFSAGLTRDDLTYVGTLEYRQDLGSTASRTSYLLRNRIVYKGADHWRAFGKLNFSDSVSSLGAFYDGRYVEGVLGYAMRPINNDKLNTVFKYSYLYNLPATDQVVGGTGAADYLQSSHVFAVDAQYDLTTQWSIGAKFAYRFGQLSMDRVNPQFFDNRGQLVALRADWHVVRNWDLMIEGRVREEIDAGDLYTGALVGAYYHVGNNLKIGGGYNFSDFSDDLTNLDYNSQGLFINVVGKF